MRVAVTIEPTNHDDPGCGDHHHDRARNLADGGALGAAIVQALLGVQHELDRIAATLEDRATE
jgi:hypothetical protein